MKDFKPAFGGSNLTGVRKIARPLSTKRPIHFIAKTSTHRLFSPGHPKIENLIFRFGARFKIRIHRLSLNWSHFHMVMVIPSRKAYNAFVRSLNAAIVSFASKFAGKYLKGIFEFRPYTRIMDWGRDFENVMAYHDLNDLEARGYVKRPRKGSTTPKPSRSNSSS